MTNEMMTTTLNNIRKHSPCREGWEKLLKGLGKTTSDDEPLPYATILNINGLNDTIWCFRAEDRYSKQWRLFAVWCAKQVLHLAQSPEVDNKTLEVAERYAEGKATTDELAASRAASWAAQVKYLEELFNSPT